MVITINTFLYADLCDFTEYTWHHGDDVSADLAVGFHELVRTLAEAASCEFVKAVGDAVMVRANHCEDAIRLACRIRSHSKARGYPPLRLGIDTGPAVARAGDWYGTTVNTAARVAEAAEPGELLLTARARDAAQIETVHRGLRELKGLPVLELHAAIA